MTGKFRPDINATHFDEFFWAKMVLVYVENWARKNADVPLLSEDTCATVHVEDEMVHVSVTQWVKGWRKCNSTRQIIITQPFVV